MIVSCQFGRTDCVSGIGCSPGGQGHARPGPGRNVIIEKSFGSPTVTKDGVTVAKEIELEDKYENMGAQMVKEVASKTSDGRRRHHHRDRLAEAIYNEGLKNVVAGVNPMLMKRGMDKAVEDIVEPSRSMSIPGQGQKEATRSPGRHHRRQQRPRDRQDHRRGDGEGRQGRRDHRRRRQEPRDRPSSSSKACSSTAATSRPTSSPTRDDGGELETPTSSSTRRRSAAIKDLVPVLEKVAKPASRC
jgi:hypothetical protein